jgi:ribosome maturation factor RimP
MKINKEYILERLQEIVSAKGLLLIDLVIRGDARNRIVEVYIDGEESVNTELCSDVSRELQHIIDTEGLLESTYRLDVSTPGVDRPLKFLQQFFKHINRNFEVLYDSNGQSKKINGKLIRIFEDDLYFQKGKEEYKINFNDIKKAKVLISF